MKRISCAILSLILIFSYSSTCFAANLSSKEIDSFIQNIVEFQLGRIENYNEISSTKREYQIIYTNNTIANITEELLLNGDKIITISEDSLTNRIIHKSNGTLLWENTLEPIIQNNLTISRRGGSLTYSTTPFYGTESDYTDFKGTTTQYYRFGMLIQYVTLTIFSGVLCAVSEPLWALMSFVQIADGIEELYADAQDDPEIAASEGIYSELETWGPENPPDFAQTGIAYSKLYETFFGENDKQIGGVFEYYSKLEVRMTD